MVAINLLAACVLDGILGDPRWMPHPVRMMGKMIFCLEGIGRNLFVTPLGHQGKGVMIAILLPGMSFGLSWWALDWVTRVNVVVGDLLWIVLAYTTLAARDLAHHAMAVYQRLNTGSLEEARKALSLIVGRDTERLTESQVVKATVETVAESTSDGVVAPLLYLVLGGPPLALAYKAVNTLDSMIGHQDSRYRDLGWASAKLDDVMNWVPARLTAGLLVVAASVALNTSREAWKIYRRDCFRHASPNSGHPEAAMAGALGVQLGGGNTYDGVLVDMPVLGDPNIPLHADHILRALKLMWVVFGLATLLGMAVMVLWNII